MTTASLVRFALVFAVLAVPAAAQDSLPAHWKQHVVQSSMLGESRTVYVATPESHAVGTARYPVLVLLDANDRQQFTAAVANVAFLASRGTIPELIVVGIPNGSDRTRDLTPRAVGSSAKGFPTAGGAERFAGFVMRDVLPMVRSAYRTLPSTVLAGHSFGGLLAMHVAAANPGAFTGIIAMSPALWWNDTTAAMAYADSIARSTASLRLFATSGGLEDVIDVPTRRFAARLDSIKPRHLAFGHRRYPDDTHGLTPLPSLIDGLRFVFEPLGLTKSPVLALRDPDSAAVVRAFVATQRDYARGARALGLPEALPQAFVNSLGYQALNRWKLARVAVWLFHQNVASYPDEPDVYDSLGDGLLAIGDSGGARARFRRAIDVAVRTGRPVDEGTRKKLAALLAAVPAAAQAAQPGFPPDDPDSWRVAGTAKILCSAVFVSGRDPAEARAHVTSYFIGNKLDSLTRFEVDSQRKLVRLTLANRITREAKLYGDQGCIIHQPGRDSVFFTPVRVTTTLPDASTMSWPMGDALPTTPLPAEIDTVKLRQAVDAAFATPDGFTTAFVVVYKGRIVAERYGNGAHKDMQLESWSMGKSIAGTWIGMLVHQGALKLDDPAPVPAWRTTPGDPRAKIRVIDLLRMSSGLRFSRGSPEDIPGYHDHDLGYTGAIDSYAFATSVPLQFEPNTVGRYRNSDPLTLGLIVRDVVRKRGEEYLSWPQRALFDRVGIRRQVLETDPYGNFLITGYDYGTARNWARIGMLYLNDGVWQGERLLPEGWTKLVSTPAPAWKDSTYGGMVWVNARGVWPALPRDAFAFRGAGLQDTYVIPSRDLVIVRMGHYIGSRAGAADLRRAQALLMEAIPARR